MSWTERIRMAKMLPHAPERCAACGGPNYVHRFKGGGGVAEGYSESGEVKCSDCGNIEGWSWEAPGLARRDPDHA